MDAKQIAEKANWGYLTSNEVDALHMLVGKIVCDDVPVVVNLGAGFGTSSIAMSEARYIRLFSFDNMPGFQEIERENFQKVGLKMPKQILSNSHSKDIIFKLDIDLLFIDADHREAEVLEDIRIWLPHMKSEGIVAFHDYKHPNFPGVKKAIDNTKELGNLILLVDTIIAFRLE